MDWKDYIALAALLLSIFNTAWQYQLNTKRDRRDQKRELEVRTPWISTHVTHNDNNPRLFVLHCNIKNQNYRPVDFVSVSLKTPGIAIAEGELQRIGGLDRYEPTTAFSHKVLFEYFRLSEGESRDFTLILMTEAEPRKPALKAALEMDLILRDNENTHVKIERVLALT